MKKIGGIKMNFAVEKYTRSKTNIRYCSIYESLKQSLKEVKLIKQGKIKAKTWDELYEELKQNKENL